MSSFGNIDISNINTPQKVEEVKNQVRKEMAMANAQELINNINKHCYKMCLGNPGSSLSSTDEGCLGRCMDKFLASWDVVSRAYIGRVQQENK
ncbi:hypothetical protein DL89DRAFT_264235 [Linderina pennispora]|uniref:Mitochondrial import inner membrane translocase subunit n=1 Tax=Linderina pennispora TaxID=61395 RepID=A0A1Y1WLZ8_9FUNG|nr:uncharacterized protein DL89DRAFT_264235 [Linderina pennispora]ORX74318.1 hypothetical protein DL89DRAFT_264235 [Linderina pennispora]